MKLSTGLSVWVMASAWLMLSAAQADEVILTSGERFTSEKVWEEKGKIRFNMNGLVVSVDKADVASIIRHDGAAPSIANPRPATLSPSPRRRQPVPTARSTAKPTRSAPSPPKQPASAPAQSSIQKSGQKSGNHQNIKGIGFDGISWHMRPTDLPGLSKIKTEEIYGGIDQYWQPDGPLSLGDVLLDGLIFGFWRNRLYTIMMWVDGKPGYERLKRVIFQRYGPGQKGKSSQDRYVWVKDKTTDRLLEFDTERNIGIFWMRSRELDAHIKAQYPASTTG